MIYVSVEYGRFGAKILKNISNKICFFNMHGTSIKYSILIKDNDSFSRMEVGISNDDEYFQLWKRSIFSTFETSWRTKDYLRWAYLGTKDPQRRLDLGCLALVFYSCFFFTKKKKKPWLGVYVLRWNISLD